MTARSRYRRGRMYAALEMRDRGMSLRQIAFALGCSHQTVANDLRDCELSISAVKKQAPNLRKKPLKFDSDLTAKPPENESAQVIPLRRKA